MVIPVTFWRENLAIKKRSEEINNKTKNQGLDDRDGSLGCKKSLDMWSEGRMKRIT